MPRGAAQATGSARRASRAPPPAASSPHRRARAPAQRPAGRPARCPEERPAACPARRPAGRDGTARAARSRRQYGRGRLVTGSPPRLRLAPVLRSRAALSSCARCGRRKTRRWRESELLPARRPRPSAAGRHTRRRCRRRPDRPVGPLPDEQRPLLQPARDGDRRGAHRRAQPAQVVRPDAQRDRQRGDRGAVRVERRPTPPSASRPSAPRGRKRSRCGGSRPAPAADGPGAMIVCAV